MKATPHALLAEMRGGVVTWEESWEFLIELNLPSGLVIPVLATDPREIKVQVHALYMMSIVLFFKVIMRHLKDKKSMKISAVNIHVPTIHFRSVDKEINHYQ